MAARKTKQPKGRKQPAPPLDHPGWVLLRKGHNTISEHVTGAQLAPIASVDLEVGLKNKSKKKNVRSMRRSLMDPSVRERLSVSYWTDLRIDVDVENNSLRLLPSLPIRRLRDFRDINAWNHYVWEPDIYRMLGKSPPKQRSPTKRRGNKHVDPARQSQGNPAIRSGAAAAAKATGAAQPEQPEQPEPEQLPKPIVERRRGGTPALSTEEIAACKEYCNQKLDADPAWIGTMGGKQKACQDIIINKIPRPLRDHAQKHWQSVLRNILNKVLEERR